MTRDEALSRLLSGDLSEAEAAVWRQRIDDDPAVRAAWDQLRALTDDLASLADPELPEALVQRTVRGTPVAPPSRPSWRWAAGGLLAAAGLAWALLPVPPPTLELVDGEQHVVGEARVVAGGVPVRVDGEATIRVEPDPHPLREWSREDSMNPGHIASFGAGVMVTIAVSQGMAWVSTPDGALEVAAGEHRSVQGQAAGEPRMIRRIIQAPSGSVLEETQALPDDERIDALEAAVAELTFERDALRGQVAAAGGAPLDWPENLATALGPDKFEATLRDVLAETGADVAEVDCSEYPCVAVLDLPPVQGDPMAMVQDIVSTLREGTNQLVDADDIGMGVQVEASEDEDGHRETKVGVALGQDGMDARDPRVATRLQDLLSR